MLGSAAPVELPDGITILKGDAILTSFGAAGHDPLRHGESAGRFDITRADKEHLAFGHGVHHCVGAPLTRMEAAIALPAPFDRFPGPRLDGTRPAPPVEPFIADGFSAVPVRL